MVVVHNLSAGPGKLDEDAVRRAHESWFSYNNLGMAFMELSHRDEGGAVQSLMVDIQRKIRDQLQVPGNYHIVLMPGGGHAQFTAVALNLCVRSRKGKPTSPPQYVDTGFWSRRAAVAGEAYSRRFYPEWFQEQTGVEETSTGCFREDSAYVYLCLNDTIHGLEYLTEPDLAAINRANVPLVVDATSTLMSRPIDVSKYGVIFAASGKNLGPPGICVVIVRNDLLQEEKDLQEQTAFPTLDWRSYAYSSPIQNLYNTPPTLVLHLVHLCLEALEEKGGVVAMEDKAKRLSAKSALLASSSSAFYQPLVTAENGSSRSRMNVCFRIGGSAAQIGPEKRAKNRALESAVVQLSGHPLAGGLRVTCYNAIPDASIDAVLKCLEAFRCQN
ncbi:unnamed protein product, partial [Amoebophrya sp. A25]|eukprot:GSA25T00011043001.1